VKHKGEKENPVKTMCPFKEKKIPFSVIFGRKITYNKHT
jgi:hypothetical protein